MDGPYSDILVVDRASLWRRRLIGVFGISSLVAGVLVLAYETLGNTSEFTTAEIVSFAWVFGVGLIFLIIATLRVNRVGIYEEGLAPPMKVLSALLSEPFVARWKDIEEIRLHPSVKDDRPPKAYWATIRLSSGKQIRFSGSIVGDRFRSELAARRFYALLAIASGRLGAGADLSPRNPEVEKALAADWPEGKEYRRTLASKLGMAVGGPLALVSAAFLVLGPIGQGLLWRALFIGGGFLGLWAALSPYFLRDLAKRLHRRRNR
jgi:hypothetical protein